jgi:hypothetical protein
MDSNNLKLIKKAFVEHLVSIGYTSVGETTDGLGIQVFLVCTDCNEVLQNSIFKDLDQLEHLVNVGKENQEFHNLCVLVGERIY